MLLLLAGFDYNNLSGTIWNINSQSRTTTNPRTGTHSVDATGGALQRDVGSNLATIIIGAAMFRTSAGAAGQFIGIRDSTSDQLTVNLNADGSLEVRRGSSGGTLLGTSATGVFPANVWNYVEIKATIDNTVGVFQLRINGTTVLNLSGIDT
ncbi:MAG: hypothetical protein ACRD32_03445, partial [Nitrososphaerales archaeon]